jgi:uncharacterized protein YutE (UPF0331/DUF86 family)
VTNRVLVLRKLATLREHVANARARRPASETDLRSDALLRDALALSVLVAIQEAIDIAFHVGTDEGWGVPATFAESFDLLARHGVLDDEVAGAMAAACALRNRIAHAYASVDVERFWRELPAGLTALDRFAQSILRFAGP